MADEEIALLRAKLEASELRHEVKELRSVVAQYQRELKESNTLLLKQRLPPRPHTNSTEKQLIAAGQYWKCAGGEDCPLKRVVGRMAGGADNLTWGGVVPKIL